MKKFLLFLIVGLIFLTTYTYGSAELGVKLATNTPVILSITPNTPAHKARLKPGDKIIQINTLPIERPVTIELLLLEAFPGETWEIKVERNGKIKKFKVKLAESSLTPEDVVIRKLTLTGNRIVLVFVPLGINVISEKPKELIQELKESIKNKILGRLESAYSNLSERFPNLTIVDRANLEELLKEIDFSKSGYISEKVRKQMGKLLGATHIYGITYSRNSLGPKIEEIWTRKLIEIDTGKIISASIVEITFTPEGKVLSEYKSWEEELIRGTPSYRASRTIRRRRGGR